MRNGPDLMGRIARAGAAIDPALSERDVERLVQGAARRRARRAGRRAALGAAALGVLVVAAVATVKLAPRYLHQPAVDSPAAVAGADGALRLRDGSLAVPLETGSTLTLVREGPDHVQLALGRGRARFDVVPIAKRAFSVEAGDVTVTVLGTAFTLERVADRVGVNVERGTVRVDWHVGVTMGTRLLHKGDSGWFPPLVVDGAQTGAAPAAAKEAPAPATSPPPVETESAVQRRPPHAHPRPNARREPAGLTAEGMLAEADAQRLAGHAEEGAALLRRLLREQPHDKRAPLAAFTLGRLLLIELDRPREAAAAFAQVRALAPRGPFAEDALAREVEAWQRAGDGDQARARAREYLKLFPSGRRIDAIRAASERE
ncbi:MAG TPA: FecR domain-containing protein [Polyangia bacterium]|nr:FecR domain-containing protein [Polyangia bacterium]